jgi:sulfite exporter TauE/SafE
VSLVVLLLTAGSLGLLGGLHCIAMCGALQRVAVHGTGGLAVRPSGGFPARDSPLDADRNGAAAVAAPGTATLGSRVIPLVPAEAGRGAGAGAGVGAGMAAGIGAGPGRWRASTIAAASGSLAALRADLVFHAARLTGYAALGAAVGAGSSLLRWGADAVPLMRPLWGTMNALLLALGLALLVLGRQPRWIDALGQQAWAATGARLDRRRAARPVAAGLAWALVPCGLLYSALATAALASEPLRGAAAMLAFGAGTAINLLAAQALVRALGRRSARRAAALESAGARIGGALLAAMAAAALVALALGQPHPFCAT